MEQEIRYAICPFNKENNLSDKFSLSTYDENWYERSAGLFFNYTKEQVEKIKKDLHNKFLYYALIIGQDGSREKWSAFDKKKKMVTSGLTIKIMI